ncbi:MAG: methyltransferase domain-containing protein [Desulfobacterales bacterium]|nr:methyltransferase domain-containing protein [Desulfobacterales bacterium]
MSNRYCINKLYRSRKEYCHYDDSSKEDQWQLEVYLHALGLMKKHNFRSIIDIGCGSGYKLMTYFEEYQTIGLELSVNVEILKEKYPERKWKVCNFNEVPDLSTDVVICSDVIEHIVDPDELISFIKGIKFEYLVISTPDRSLMHKPWKVKYYGPPKNKSHIREWTFNEFNRYISSHFKVIDHRVTNLGQFTQMAICTPL